ncbi:MAG TPA: FAD-binding oxidoreductase, partial [Vicinamibacterales bacterium]|nr:FAD-binding oxidoreductase [Vicinamibacterales bacterium]
MTRAIVNDVHSQLNPTQVASIAAPRTVDELADTIVRARSQGRSVSIAGGRHAMGGQQFGTGTVHVDTRGLNHVVAFDRERGIVSVQGGIQWPEVMAWLEQSQQGCESAWGIHQKQTGADRLCVGGALSCNCHGRGLTLPPIVGQIESFDLVGSGGGLRTCSRDRHAELFRLAIGGYGLFGVIARVDLRLRPRVKVRRVVDIADTTELIDRFEERIRDG